MRRRQYLAGIAVTIPAFAGCSGLLEPGTDSPDGLVETWYIAWEDDDADEMEALLHSKTDWEGHNMAPVDPPGGDLTVEEEDLDQGTFADYTDGFVDGEHVSEIVENEDTALVSVGDNTYVVATDGDDEWRMLARDTGEADD